MNAFLKGARFGATPGPYKIGDRVEVQMFGGYKEAVVVEDRGPLGVKGERVYGVRIRQDEWNEILTERTISQMRPKKGAEDPSNGQV